MLYVKKKNYKLNSLLLVSKNSPGKKFILSKNIAILLRKKFKRTFFALNPESWVLGDPKGCGRWHLEKISKFYTLHYDRFDPERGLEFATAHFLYDLPISKELLILGLLWISWNLLKK